MDQLAKRQKGESSKQGQTKRLRPALVLVQSCVDDTLVQQYRALHRVASKVDPEPTTANYVPTAWYNLTLKEGSNAERSTFFRLPVFDYIQSTALQRGVSKLSVYVQSCMELHLLLVLVL